MSYVVKEGAVVTLTEKEKIIYAARYTFKWFLVPLGLSIVFLLFVKTGCLTGTTDNIFTTSAFYISNICSDAITAAAEGLAFLFVIGVSYISREKKIFFWAKMALAKCIFLLNFFPMIYFISMFFRINFVPWDLRAGLSVVGFLLGAILIYVLPVQPPPEYSIHRKK